MKLLFKLLVVFTVLFSVNITAATISGNIKCDINGNGTIETDEICPSEAVWVKLLNVARDRLIAQVPLYPSGAFMFNVNVTGDFVLFIDNNGDIRDSTPTPPSNSIFGDPLSGSLSIAITATDEINAGNDFVLIPDPSCDCTAGDNNLTIAPIVIDGIMDDWAVVIPDPDNGRCDSGTVTDYDTNKTINGVIQSTGRNLTHFVWTGQNDENGFVYGYTERVGSSTNTETFLFYKDGDADGLMENGDIALTASWSGNTGTVKMEICDYVVNTTDGDANSDFMVWQQSDVGTPLSYPAGATVPQEWVGSADGYTIQGGLTNCRTASGLVGSGSADGRSMEWQVPWKVVNMLPFQPITYHISTMNAAVNLNNPPGQIDDNLGSCMLQAPVVKLDVNKTVDNPTPRIGENVTYTITVTNSGDSTNSVVVNDTLPNGLQYVSYTGTDWTCTNSGPDINCTYTGVLMNGGSISVDIVASVNDNTSLWGQTRTNTACASSDENTTLICDTENITIYSPEVALDLSKTVSNATPFIGASIFYTVTITNNGPDIANNIVVDDTLPSGVSYTSYFGDDWTCTDVANVLDCNYNVALGAGATTELFIIVDVTGTAGTSYTNTAFTHADENTTDVSDSVTITPVAPPAPATLTVEKGVSNTSPLTGDTIVYGIIISNVGGVDANNVVLKDLLPSGVTYVSTSYDTALGGIFTDTPPDGNITWSGFTLPFGTSTIIQITATVDAAENVTVSNQACAHHDIILTDVCSDANFTVRVPDVQLLMDKSVDNENPRVDENVIYTLVVTNNGTDTANNVIVNDPLPAGVTYVSSLPLNAYDDGTGVWTVGTLSPGASSELTITVSIDPGGEGDLITNIADAVADENGTPVLDDANLTVYTPIVILTIQKVSDQNFPAEGENITYTVIVNNIGDDNATNVMVTDTLPNGVTYLNAGGNGWTCSDLGTIDCSYANEIAPGFPTSFDINVTVNPGTSGTTLTNTVCIDDPTALVPICGESNINVNQFLDLVVTKVVNNPAPSVGETIQYTITVTNNGPINATGVEITEDVYHIIGLVNVSTVPTLADDDTWIVGDLNVGETATLQVTATVGSGASGNTYVNNAVLTGLDQTDIEPSNNHVTATIAVVPSAPTPPEPEDCLCDDVNSDSSSALNTVSAALMILMTLMLGLFFVRREELNETQK